MKTHITLLTLALFSLSALAADVTGTWKAEFDTQRGLQKYTFALQQDGTSVTGKANVERDGEKREAELKEGKVEGDTLTFVEPLKSQDNELRITYTGKISGTSCSGGWVFGADEKPPIHANVSRFARPMLRDCPPPIESPASARLSRSDFTE